MSVKKIRGKTFIFEGWTSTHKSALIDLKEIMMQEIDVKLDHGFMMWVQDPFKVHFDTMKFTEKQKIIFVLFVPTAENIAKYLFGIMNAELLKRKIPI